MTSSLTVLTNPTGRDIDNRYELGQELSRGEFRVTYLCTDWEGEENLACKSISKKKLRTVVDIEDVRREVDIMRHLPQHSNIVTLKVVQVPLEIITGPLVDEVHQQFNSWIYQVTRLYKAKEHAEIEFTFL